MTDPRAAMQEFFEVLFEVHPRLDFRTPMALLLEERRRCEAGASACESPVQFRRLAGRFLHLVGDGHTYLDLPAAGSVAAPVRFAVVEGVPVVSASLRDDLPVRRGDAVLAVGGREAARVVQERLAEEAFAEVAWGTRRAVERLLTFPLEEAPGGEVAVTVAGPDGRVRTEALPLLPAEVGMLGRPGQEDVAERWRRPFFSGWAGEVAILTYRACTDRSVGNAGAPDMAETCAELFTEMRRRRTRRLVIDIRGNVGGNSVVGNRIYPYLCDRDMTTYGWTTRVSGISRRHLSSIRDHAPGDIVVPPQRMPWPYQRETRPPAGLPPFGGEVAVLIDAGVFSSGEWFAVDLRDNGIGTFIGEPTGCGGSVPGEILRIPLPAAGADLFCACRMYTRPGPDQGAVKPQVFARPTLADFRAGRDPVLESALHMPLG